MQNNTMNTFNNCQIGLRPSLTRQFHLDRASLLCRCARLGEYGALARRFPRGKRKITAMGREQQTTTKN